jgi:hypothetical protein
MEKDELYEEYVVWLKETHNLTPEETFGGINAILEIVSLRDEVLGRMGETQLVKMMKEDGVFEQRKKEMENSTSMILTFDEYKNSKQK